MKRLFAWGKIGLACLLLALLSGCAGFGQRWAAAPAPTPRDPFAGKWDGAWASAKRPGEGGRLRCVFTPLDRGRYEAAFHAHWKIFASDYTAIFDTERHGPRLVFQGEHQMPAIFGGMYRFEGSVTPVKFFASYQSGYDVGTFDMGRGK